MKLLSFIKWVFLQIGISIATQNRHFRRTLRDETGLGFFLWIMSTVISTLLIMMALGLTVALTGIRPPAELLVAWVSMWVIYLVYTGFSLMYNAFESERAELFDTIKNGR